MKDDTKNSGFNPDIVPPEALGRTRHGDKQPSDKNETRNPDMSNDTETKNETKKPADSLPANVGSPFPGTVPLEALSESGDIITDDVDFLLFDGNDGEWTYGRGRDELPKGSQAIVVIDELLTGFTRFGSDGRPTSAMLPIWPVPDLAALRASLGDIDPMTWERDDKGPRDPWRVSRKLPMFLLPYLEPLLFSTTSSGGVIAVSKLRLTIQRQRRDPDAPDALPVIEFGSSSYESKRGNTIFNPVLDIIEWTTMRELIEARRLGRFELPALEAPEPLDEVEEERPIQRGTSKPRTEARPAKPSTPKPRRGR
jgi:hypothetical protein